ncbi:DUF3613 domain-containing protein [Stenotrophomonas nitritireducens]|uniref:DUF3613 domain-containing protein n=1 Tax=Stenotrophomonas nitritireducens TaxID=83617 RepID=UPI003D98AA25
MTRPAFVLCLLLATPAHAQHPPLTARTDMPAVAPQPAAPEPASATPAADAPARSQIGDTTRALLRLQAEGTQAGNALPMLGEAASRSYQRHLDSFKHPVPEYFDAALPTSGSGRSGR